MTLKKFIQIYIERSKQFETVTINQVIRDLRCVRSIGRAKIERKNET